MKTHDELHLDAALAALCARLTPVVMCEPVPVAEVGGRTLAKDFIAPVDLPAFPNAAMDGYAVRAADCRSPTRLHVAGAAHAGHPFDGALQPGMAVRIMTGAPLPEGADAVVMQEDALRDGDSVVVAIDVAPGLHVRPRGQHVRLGEVLIAARMPLHAPEIGLATAVGATTLTVIRRLHVGVASTGDELVDPPARPGPAGTIDGTRPMIAAVCRSAGFRVSDFGICADRAAAFDSLLRRAGQRAVDALLVIGGSALGDADVVRQAAQVEFLPLAIRPGRGVTFAWIGAKQAAVMLGLPGNAVAAFVMFQLFVLPALHYLGGRQVRIPPHFPLPLAEEIVCEAGRVDYRRGRLERNAAGAMVVRPLQLQGAAMLRTLIDADVLIAAGPEPRYGRGSAIGVVPLASLPR